MRKKKNPENEIDKVYLYLMKALTGRNDYSYLFAGVSEQKILLVDPQTNQEYLLGVSKKH